MLFYVRTTLSSHGCHRFPSTITGTDLGLFGQAVDAEAVRVGAAPKVEEVRAGHGRPERGALHGRVRPHAGRIVDQHGVVAVLELVRAFHVEVHLLRLHVDLADRHRRELCDAAVPNNCSTEHGTLHEWPKFHVFHLTSSVKKIMYRPRRSLDL